MYQLHGLVVLVLATLVQCLSARASVEFQDELHYVGQQLPGEPTGYITKIEGVDTYVSLPKDLTTPPEKALLFLTDIYGIPLVNNKLLADQFAGKGYATFIPDYFDGDPVPVNQTGFNITAWRLRHTEETTTVPLLKVIRGLRKTGVRTFAATGYCWGGRFVLRLSQNNTIAVGITAHPSQLKVPDDFIALSNVGKAPLQIHSAEFDGMFSPTVAPVADSVMNATGPYGDLTPYRPGYVRVHHLGVGHGFAVRPANTSDSRQIAALQAAFEMTVAFLTQHF